LTKEPQLLNERFAYLLVPGVGALWLTSVLSHGSLDRIGSSSSANRLIHDYPGHDVWLGGSELSRRFFPAAGLDAVILARLRSFYSDPKMFSY
jgi:hypothetical protein